MKKITQVVRTEDENISISNSPGHILLTLTIKGKSEKVIEQSR